MKPDGGFGQPSLGYTSGHASFQLPRTQPVVTSTSRLVRHLILIILLSLAVLASILLSGTSSFFTSPDSRVATQSFTFDDPSRDFKDDVWPLREQTPWDISTDYPYPRSLEYDVTEGTWLRLDVHPKSGDIIFDMLGDIYCLPGRAYSSQQLMLAIVTRAKPILLGVPHDSDPHFSPDGNSFVFRSDAGLGVENIWITTWAGCDNMDLRPEIQGDSELSSALRTKNHDDEMLAKGVKEDEVHRRRRLIREGRFVARRVTNETYRWVSDARFHPSGTKVIATKWYTSSRSLGAGEGWEYAVPDELESEIPVGSGQRVVGRTLPLGWGSGSYGDQQIGPEQFVWHGQDSLIYSKNVGDTNGRYAYSKDAHTGIYAIFETNLTSGRTTTLVNSFPGGASRPELSRDGRTLAFVRRVRDKEALVLKDLVTGTIRHIWHGLTYDLSVISAPMGTYPSFAFTPKDDAIVIWAAGQIYHVPLKANVNGEKVSSGAPSPIRFKAHVEKRIAETVTTEVDLLPLETSVTQRVHAFLELRVNEAGSKATFQAAGATYVHDVGKAQVSRPREVPKLHPTAPYFSPSFVPGSDHLIVHARWSDVNYTTFELVNLYFDLAVEITGLPLGRYHSLVVSEGQTTRRKVAFIKTSGDYMTGDFIATAGAGLYVGEIELPSTSSVEQWNVRSVPIERVRFISGNPNGYDHSKTKIRFLDGSSKILFQQSQEAIVYDIASGPNKFGDYNETLVASGAMSTELSVSLTEEGRVDVGFVDFFHVYFAPGVDASEDVWSKPGKATKNLARLSLDGGHDVIWSGDGKRLFWFLGPYLHFVDVTKLEACSDVIRRDPIHFGISCTKRITHYEELIVEYPTDISRLKKEALSSPFAQSSNKDDNFLIIYNATLLTMESGPREDLLHDAVLIIKSGEIEAIVGVQDFVPSAGTKTIDAEGGFIVPGYIDVHAHWEGFAEYFPSRSWEMETFLAYGVTTLHNPSADNTRGFWERFRVERGQAVGPRIFQVGDIIYGAGAAGIHQDIVDMEEAFSALIRIKAEGGPASFSYKNYNLPSRASRQRLLLAARKLGMLCVPEGGMNFDWDQTYIVDGMTTVEHPLPIPQLYDDVITLFALSGTGSTPTHIVNYGGVFGEQYVWATEDIPNDEKLRRFTRHDILEGLSESTARPKNSYGLFNTSISTAKMVHMGLRAHIGAHGEPPIGLNYHAEMFFASQGGLTNYEAIRAATSDAAKTLGIYSAVGSLTPGKLADFLVYPPGVDLLHGDIRGTRDIRFVARGGRLWDAETLTEVWPVKGRREPLPPLNPE